MKSPLHAGALVVIVIFTLACPAKLYSQSCNVSNLRIKVNNIITTSTSCQVNASISWIQQSNSANRYTNFHIWTGDKYPSTLLSYSKPPSATDLANSLGTFVIDNPGSSTPSFDAGYPQASGIPLIAATASTVVSKTANYLSTGKDSFNVSNVLITLSSTVSCSSHFILKADIWSSQSSMDKTVQCFTTGGTFTTADVVVAGQTICTTPRQFQAGISTSSVGNVNFTYQVYADQANTGSFDQSDPIIYSGSGITSSGSSFSSGQISNASYGNSSLIVVVQVQGNPISTYGAIPNTCAVPLPVNFTYFKAASMQDGAQLSWGTGMEQNNKGFEVQRKTGNRNFETITFVPSKMSDGNSHSPLAYEYTDVSSLNGQVEYRLAQIDLDGQKKYSSVAMVNAVERSSQVSVYPNPSPNGAVTLVFPSFAPKSIMVYDISGRAVRTVSGVTTNQYTLSGLQGGIYILKVINNGTSETFTGRILVTK